MKVIYLRHRQRGVRIKSIAAVKIRYTIRRPGKVFHLHTVHQPEKWEALFGLMCISSD